jgi:hypothetical protein
MLLHFTPDQWTRFKPELPKSQLGFLFFLFHFSKEILD